MTRLLNLPRVVVEKIQETENTLILFVKSIDKTAVCPRCGQTSHRLHQNKRHLVKDLPLNNKDVILSVNRRRFKCEQCQKPFSEVLDFVPEKKFYDPIRTIEVMAGFEILFCERYFASDIFQEIGDCSFSSTLTVFTTCF